MYFSDMRLVGIYAQATTSSSSAVYFELVGCWQICMDSKVDLCVVLGFCCLADVRFIAVGIKLLYRIRR